MNNYKAQKLKDKQKFSKEAANAFSGYRDCFKQSLPNTGIDSENKIHRNSKIRLAMC